MSALTKAPEALAQAATQAAGAAVQGVSGALGPGNDSPDVGETDPGLPVIPQPLAGARVRPPPRLGSDAADATGCAVDRADPDAAEDARRGAACAR